MKARENLEDQDYNSACDLNMWSERSVIQILRLGVIEADFRNQMFIGMMEKEMGKRHSFHDIYLIYNLIIFCTSIRNISSIDSELFFV